jgi:hypothetical protein
MRGGVAVLMAAFAASMLPTDPVIGAAAGVVAVLVAIMALTGLCPADWFASRRRRETPQNTLGFREAHQHVDLSRPATTHDRSSHVHQ